MNVRHVILVGRGDGGLRRTVAADYITRPLRECEIRFAAHGLVGVEPEGGGYTVALAQCYSVVGDRVVGTLQVEIRIVGIPCASNNIARSCNKCV